MRQKMPLLRRFSKEVLIRWIEENNYKEPTQESLERIRQNLEDEKDYNRMNEIMQRLKKISLRDNRDEYFALHAEHSKMLQKILSKSQANNLSRVTRDQ